jgi:hypothetical protein
MQRYTELMRCGKLGKAFITTVKLSQIFPIRDRGNHMADEQQLPLAGKVALVTGSGQGIGREAAVRLGKAGADIVINYRSNAGAAAETKAAIEALGRRCIVVQADVRKRMLRASSLRLREN